MKKPIRGLLSFGAAVVAIIAAVAISRATGSQPNNAVNGLIGAAVLYVVWVQTGRR